MVSAKRATGRSRAPNGFGKGAGPCCRAGGPRAIGNLQQWLIGTYHGVSRAQLHVYLDEFVFRHNRRRQPMGAFQTLLGLGSGRSPTAGRTIRRGWGSATIPREALTPTYRAHLSQADTHKNAGRPHTKIISVG